MVIELKRNDNNWRILFISDYSNVEYLKECNLVPRPRVCLRLTVLKNKDPENQVAKIVLCMELCSYSAITSVLKFDWL